MGALSAPTLRVEEHGPDIGGLVLAAPERRNPLDHAVLDALEDELLSGRRSVVVLSADPGPAFSAGGDLSLPEPELLRVSDRIYALCRRLSETPTVLVVAADGLAVGGGAHLLLAADLRIAGPRLRFQPALPDRGLAAGAWLLPATVGRGRALDLLLSGRALDAEEALAWGVVDRVADDPTARALALAESIAVTPARHRDRVKRCVAEATAWEALAYEQATFAVPGRAAVERSA